MSVAENDGNGNGKRNGRPCKLTPELEATILGALAEGNYIETAAALAGVCSKTVYDWLREGARAKSGKKHDFLQAVEKAQAIAEAKGIRSIKAAEDAGAWQAAAWRLERKFPDRWGRKERHELTGADGGAIRHEDVADLSAYTDEELRKIQAIHEAARDRQRDTGGSANGEGEA